MNKSKYFLKINEIAEISGKSISVVSEYFKNQPSKRIAFSVVKSFFKSIGFKYPAKSFALINLMSRSFNVIICYF